MMARGNRAPVRLRRVLLALAVPTLALLGGVALAGDGWNAWARSYGSVNQRTDFRASLMKEVNTPMPHFVDVAGEQDHAIPYEISRVVDPNQPLYFEHYYELHRDFQFQPNTRYKIVIEYFDSVNQTWHSLNERIFTS